MDLKFNNKYAGYNYTGTGYIYKLDETSGRFRGVSSALDGDSVKYEYVLTGYYANAQSDGSVMAQTSTGYFLDMTNDSWNKGSQAQLYSQNDAQLMVNRMIENNKQILMNNLLCARFAHHLTTEQRSLLYDLQTRLQQRNERLLKDGYIKDAKQQEAYGYNALNNSLVQFMNGGVGVVISTTTAIVVTCLVIGSMATAAYFAYRYLYDQSAKDIKYSNDLTQTLLSKLTPEEYQQLMEETQGIVTRASIKARLGNSVGWVKWILIGLGGFMLYNIFTTKVKKQKTPKK